MNIEKQHFPSRVFFHHRRSDAFLAIGRHSHRVLLQWLMFIRPISLDKDKLTLSDKDELSSFDKIGLVGKLIEGEEDSGKTDQQ